MSRVSVLMPVYNAERFVGEAIQSILDQTYAEFDLIVVDDCSTDRSADLVRGFKDPRIRFHRNETNLGLAGVRNRLLDLARGEFVAWLDADDVARPKRLALQVSVLDAEPGIGLVGSWLRTIGLNREQTWRYPVGAGILNAHMLFANCFATSTILVRKELFDAHGIRFREDYPPAEDYDVWQRLLEHCDAHMLPQVLVDYRIHPMQTSRDRQSATEWSVRRIQTRQLSVLLDNWTEEEAQTHLMLGLDGNLHRDSALVERTGIWLTKLAHANRARRVYSAKDFREVLGQVWFFTCQSGGLRSFRVGLRYFMHRLAYLGSGRVGRALRVLYRSFRG